MKLQTEYRVCPVVIVSREAPPPWIRTQQSASDRSRICFTKAWDFCDLKGSNAHSVEVSLLLAPQLIQTYAVLPVGVLSAHWRRT